jgi:hypothetical protein
MHALKRLRHAGKQLPQWQMALLLDDLRIENAELEVGAERGAWRNATSEAGGNNGARQLSDAQIRFAESSDSLFMSNRDEAPQRRFAFDDLVDPPAEIAGVEGR